MFDFNNAPSQQTGFDLISQGTMCRVHMTIRPGQAGHGGMLTQSKSSDAKYLDCEFVIVSEPLRGRKIWQNMTLEGSEARKAIDISAALIRAALNSARNVRPDDDSDRARQARIISSYADLNDIEFAVKIGIQKGNNGYADKNTIQAVIEPGDKNYETVMGGVTVSPNAVPGAGKASWAPAQSAAPAPAYGAPQTAQAPRVAPAPSGASWAAPAPQQQNGAQGAQAAWMQPR